MPESPSVTIVNVGYRSTNFWVISAGTSRLLVDLGWPGTMGTMRANLERMDIELSEIRGGFATHYHPDHAGLAEELKRAGMPLIVLESQVDFFPLLKQWTKPQDRFTDITPDRNFTLAFADSRAWLAGIGFTGEILPTPGHSDDSVSLLLDDGNVFTGDLTAPALCGDDAAGRQALASWQSLREHGAKRVFPGHGPQRPLAR